MLVFRSTNKDHMKENLETLNIYRKELFRTAKEENGNEAATACSSSSYDCEIETDDGGKISVQFDIQKLMEALDDDIRSRDTQKFCWDPKDID